MPLKRLTPLWLLWLFFLASGTPGAQTAAPDHQPIVVARVTGVCTITLPGKTLPEPLADGTLVPAGATVQTLAQSSLVLVSADAVMAHLGANTGIVVDTLGSGHDRTQ